MGAALDLQMIANLTGRPSITVPCGFDTEGLPIGLQLIGRARCDHELLGVASEFQRRTSWHTRRPAITAAPVATIRSRHGA